MRRRIPRPAPERPTRRTPGPARWLRRKATAPCAAEPPRLPRGPKLRQRGREALRQPGDAAEGGAARFAFEHEGLERGVGPGRDLDRHQLALDRALAPDPQARDHRELVLGVLDAAEHEVAE